MKSIFVADHCLQASNHYCVRHFQVDRSKKISETLVDATIAYVHHYRDNVGDQKFQEFFAKDGTLAKPKLILDDSILAFEDQLLYRIKARLELFNM